MTAAENVRLVWRGDEDVDNDQHYYCCDAAAATAAAAGMPRPLHLTGGERTGGQVHHGSALQQVHNGSSVEAWGTEEEGAEQHGVGTSRTTTPAAATVVRETRNDPRNASRGGGAGNLNSSSTRRYYGAAWSLMGGKGAERRVPLPTPRAMSNTGRSSAVRPRTANARLGMTGRAAPPVTTSATVASLRPGSAPRARTGERGACSSSLLSPKCKSRSGAEGRYRRTMSHGNSRHMSIIALRKNARARAGWKRYAYTPASNNERARVMVRTGQGRREAWQQQQLQQPQQGQETSRLAGLAGSVSVYAREERGGGGSATGRERSEKAGDRRTPRWSSTSDT